MQTGWDSLLIMLRRPSACCSTNSTSVGCNQAPEMGVDSEICQPFSITSISHLCSSPLGPHTELRQRLQSLRFWVHMGTFKIIRSNQGCASQERLRCFLIPFPHQILNDYVIVKDRGAQPHQAPWSFSACPEAQSTHTLLSKSCVFPFAQPNSGSILPYTVNGACPKTLWAGTHAPPFGIHVTQAVCLRCNVHKSTSTGGYIDEALWLMSSELPHAFLELLFQWAHHSPHSCWVWALKQYLVSSKDRIGL